MNRTLSSSVVTITGGTGSFGSTMLRHLLANSVAEVRIFSRDENKQDELRNEIRDDRLKFFIGDVRDFASVDAAIRGSDFVFHAAALKQVPSCEFFPMQAVATNISGSTNVIESAVKNEVKSIVCLSTDKAVYPINVMGMSKAVMEKVAQSYARNDSKSQTSISITRYGNVMMSRGSVIPLFAKQLISGRPVTITNPNMTRFLMSLDDSVELVKYAFLNGASGDLFVKKAPACTVETLVFAIAKALNLEQTLQMQVIGTRHGEKLFESLLGSEERNRSIEHPAYFQVPLDTRSLDYQIFFDKGQPMQNEQEAYTSHNTNQLTVDEVALLLRNLPQFQRLISGF